MALLSKAKTQNSVVVSDDFHLGEKLSGENFTFAATLKLYYINDYANVE